jgi:hypothetical protein
MIRLFLTLALLAATASAKPLSAFEAVEMARKQIKPVTPDTLIQIHGEPCSLQTLPVAWTLLFFDRTASQHGIKVEISGNTITGIYDGYTQIDGARLAAYKLHEAVRADRLKVDSSDVLRILQNATPLQGVKITSLGLSLRKEGKLPNSPVVWNCRLFAATPDGKKETSLGTARVDAFTGAIHKLDVRPAKAKAKARNS